MLIAELKKMFCRFTELLRMCSRVISITVLYTSWYGYGRVGKHTVIIVLR